MFETVDLQSQCSRMYAHYIGHVPDRCALIGREHFFKGGHTSNNEKKEHGIRSIIIMPFFWFIAYVHPFSYLSLPVSIFKNPPQNPTR